MNHGWFHVVRCGNGKSSGITLILPDREKKVKGEIPERDRKMVLIMTTEWKKLSSLRRTSFNSAGGYYSEEYAVDRGIIEQVKAGIMSKRHAVWIPEPIEVSIDANGDVSCRYNKEICRKEKQKEYLTSFGVFVSHDCGEFGGNMMTPKETIHGNFCDVFNSNKKVYAIDTLNHMGVAHTKIYEFSSDIKATLIYATEPKEWIEYKCRYTNGESMYILVSGRILGKDGFKDSKSKSYLFRISDNGFFVEAEFDRSFYYAYNMIMHNRKMILGMDKVVAVIDVDKRESDVIYTLIDMEAEIEIERMNTIV